MPKGAAAVKQEQGQDDGEQRASKRKCVQSACQPCRKRKSKCDGGLPICATCTAVYKTPCSYDTEGEARRGKNNAVAGTKRNSSVVSHHAPPPQPPPNDNAEFLLSSIRTLPEHEVYELIQQIRKDARLDIAGLAETWRKAVTIPPSAVPSIEPDSLEVDLSMLLGKPTQTYAGESRYFGHTSGLSLIPEIPEAEHFTGKRLRAASASVERKSPTWTTITNDIALVERLLDLYFRWSHPCYVIFSRECFYKDFRSGREKYCSPLLVNAILAYGCHYTHEPAGRTDPDNFRTAGDHFFEEARRLLFEDENPSLTTTQALCVMAMREPSAGRDSTGYMYMGRCMRMAIELGLHLNNSAAPSMELTPTEMEVRKITFWGCFTVDTVWSICVGRLSQLPRAAITLDKPMLGQPPEGLRPEAYLGGLLGTVTKPVFLQEFCTLSELINDNNFMFFAPKDRFTSWRLLECYNKYKAWYKNLPQELRLEGVREPLAHIIVLHMLYYTTIVHLFRPMLKVDLIHSDVRPRDTCIDAANQVAILLRLYRKHYSMRNSHLVLTHILLSVNIVHLLYSTASPYSYRNLVEGLEATDEMGECHYFGRRGFKIVHALSKVWNLPFPEEVADRILKKGESNLGIVSPQAGSVLGPPQNAKISGRLGGGGGAGYRSGVQTPTIAQPTRRESHSILAGPIAGKPVQVPTQFPSSTSTSQPPDSGILVPNQQHPHYRNSVTQPHIIPSYTSSSSPIPQPAPQSTAQHLQQAISAETLFWTPVPGMGVPILPRTNYQVSPMDLDNLLGRVTEWDRFSRDGFKMSDQWTQDPMEGAFGMNGAGAETYGNGVGVTEGDFANRQGHEGSGFTGIGGQHQGSQAFDVGWWGGDGG